MTWDNSLIANKQMSLSAVSKWGWLDWKFSPTLAQVLQKRGLTEPKYFRVQLLLLGVCDQGENSPSLPLAPWGGGGAGCPRRWTSWSVLVQRHQQRSRKTNIDFHTHKSDYGTVPVASQDASQPGRHSQRKRWKWEQTVVDVLKFTVVVFQSSIIQDNFRDHNQNDEPQNNGGVRDCQAFE